jgi:hypothetical protein
MTWSILSCEDDLMLSRRLERTSSCPVQCYAKDELLMYMYKDVSIWIASAELLSRLSLFFWSIICGLIPRPIQELQTLSDTYT